MEELGDFETNLARLEEVVQTLERGGVPLQRALQLFEEGMTLLGKLQKALEVAEARVERLVRDVQGELVTEPFSPPR